MLNFIILAASVVEEHAEPTAWFLTPGGWVAMSMVAVFGIMLKAKVPAIVASILDKHIGSIREQLDAATQLRAEAEALKNEYVGKAKAADDDITAMRVAAKKEADEIIARSKIDAKLLIERRSKMAEDNIAAAEQAAIADVRAKAASLATTAAEQLIIANHAASADAKLIDTAIAGLN